MLKKLLVGLVVVIGVVGTSAVQAADVPSVTLQELGLDSLKNLSDQDGLQIRGQASSSYSSAKFTLSGNLNGVPYSFSQSSLQSTSSFSSASLSGTFTQTVGTATVIFNFTGFSSAFAQ